MTDDAFGGYRGMWRNAEEELNDLRGKAQRYRAALTSISAHGMLNDNDASMVWTARVALNGDPEIAPAHLREIIRERF